MTAQRYLDDLEVGELLEAPPITLTTEHFTIFSEMTGDEHPIHYDMDYARQQGLDAPIAHGLLVLATTAFGASPASKAFHNSMIAMLGSEARFRNPAFVGDTLNRRFEVAAIEPKGIKRGIVHLFVLLQNQKGEIVLEGKHSIMLKRR